MRASSLLDPHILQWAASIRLYFSGYTFVSEMGTVHLEIWRTWWRIVAPSLPCKTATPDPLESTTLRMCGRTDGCKVCACYCRIITMSPTSNVAFGLSHCPPLACRYISLSRCWAIARFLMASGMTSRTAPRFFNSNWKFLSFLGSSSITSSSTCCMVDGNKGCLP